MDEKKIHPVGVEISGGIVQVQGDIIGGHKIISLPPPKATALHQLQPPTADFIGRTDELAELLDAVRSQGVTITGIHGMAGVGKMHKNAVLRI